MEIDTETLAYPRQIKFLSTQNSFGQPMQPEAKTTEAEITIKVLMKGLAVAPTDIRIQVTSDEDIQLYFQADIENAGKENPDELSSRYGIRCEMRNFIPIFKSLL